MNNNNDNRNDNIQKIIDNVDIVDVISDYVTLEKKGNDYKGLCPFHNDSNPSLSVSPSKKVFKCFSCNTAGNVIQFIQKIKNISFVEAMKELAQKYNIDISIKENPMAARNRKYYKIMEDATKAYEFYLTQTKEGEKALEYLKKRNINEDVIKRFRIGLSSHTTDLIVKTQIEENKVLPLDLQEVKLVMMNNNKSYYDLFRGRIMFPLKDLSGNIVGFSGRIYDTESNAKYLNSPESVIFNKGNMLFNYSDAVNEIKKNDHVIVFEGFMDVIAAYKAGVYNTLATMGTALTEDQIKIILKLTNNVTLCYDGDNPGINAMKRAIALFSKYGVIVKAVELENGLDPDDYLNKYGKEKTFDLLVKNNISSIDYLYNIEKRNLNINDPTTIALFEKNIFKLIKYFKSKSLMNYLFKKLSNDLEMEISDIENDYKNINLLDDKIKYQKQETPTIDIDPNDIPIEAYGDINDLLPPEDEIIDIPYQEKRKQYSRHYSDAKYLEAEEKIISLAYKNKKTSTEIYHKLGIDNYVDKINRDLLWKIYYYYDIHENMNYDEFKGMLNELELDHLNAIINMPYITFDEKMIDDYVSTIQKHKYIRGIEDCKKDFVQGINREETLVRSVEIKKKVIKVLKTSKKPVNRD